MSPFLPVEPHSAREWDNWELVRELRSAKLALLVQDKLLVWEGAIGCSRTGRQLPFFLGPTVLLTKMAGPLWASRRSASLWPAVLFYRIHEPSDTSTPLMSDSKYDLVVSWEGSLGGLERLRLMRACEAHAIQVASLAPRVGYSVFICCDLLLLAGPFQLPNFTLSLDFCVKIHGPVTESNSSV